jgi:hypothetical protein
MINIDFDWLTRQLLCPKPRQLHDADLRYGYVVTRTWPLLSLPFAPDGFDIISKAAFHCGDRVTRVVLAQYSEVKTVTREMRSWLPLDLDDAFYDRQDPDQGIEFDTIVSRRRFVPRNVAQAWLDEISALVDQAPQEDHMCDGSRYMVVIRKGGFVRSGSFYLRYAPDVQALLRNIEWQDVRELDSTD